MSKYIVSGNVTTVSYDGYEFEIFLQSEEREDWTDYDFILKSKGKKAEDLDKIISVGDSIFIERKEEEK